MLGSALRGLCLALLSVALLCGVAADGPARGKKPPPGRPRDRDGRDDVVGARWRFTLIEKGRSVDKGTFRAVDSKIFHGSRLIGAYVQTARDRVQVEFVDGPLLGVADLRMTKTKPATLRDDLIRPSGQKDRLVLVVLND